MESISNPEHQPPTNPETGPTKESIWERLKRSHGFGEPVAGQIPEGIPTEDLGIEPLTTENIPQETLEPEFHTDQLAAVSIGRIKWNKERFKEGLEIAAGTAGLLAAGILYGAVKVDGKLLHYALKQMDPGFVRDIDRHYNTIMNWWKRMRGTETRQQQERRGRVTTARDERRELRDIEEKEDRGEELTDEERTKKDELTVKFEQVQREQEARRLQPEPEEGEGGEPTPQTPPATPEPGETQEDADQRVRREQALEALAGINLGALFGFEQLSTAAREEREKIWTQKIFTGAKRTIMTELPDEETRKQFEDTLNKNGATKELEEFLKQHIPEDKLKDIIQTSALRLSDEELERARRREENRQRRRNRRSQA